VSYILLNTSRVHPWTSSLVEWFRVNGRKLPWRNDSNAYKVLVTEKLLQQTSFGHVLKIYELFFIKYPSIDKLASSNITDIEKEIKQLGFQKQRATHLKKMAETIVMDYKSVIPNDRILLINLYGVGNYIADAVLCYAFNEKVIPVDVNIRRIAKRLFRLDSKLKYNEIQEKMSFLLDLNLDIKQLNWALLDFSNIICSRKPKCKNCFAQNSCNYYLVNYK